MHESKCDRQGAVLLNDERFLRAPNQDEAIEIQIIGDDHLECEGRAIHITPAVLALNGLLMCRREGPVPVQTIRDKVGYDASHGSFRDDMDTISETLTSLTAIPEALSRPGTSRAKRYYLSDLLDFIDRRQDAATDPSLRQLYFDLVSELPKIADYDGRRVEFESRDARRRAFAAMLREVADDPSVRWLGEQLTSEGQLHRLSSETIASNFNYVERALATFMQPDYGPTTRAGVIEGAMAYQELLFSLIPKVQVLSGQFATPNTIDKDELFQEAMFAVMEDIMIFDPHSLEHGTLDQYFYTHMAVVASGNMRRQYDLARWDMPGIGQRQRELIRTMSREGKLLEQELGREPSPAEIADRVKVDVDLIEEVLRMMARKPLPLDYVDDDGKNDGIEYRVLRMTGQLDLISEAIESIDRQLQVDAIFGSEEIETRGKIALSLYYGIYIPHLGGKAFAKNRTDRGDWFVYPSNEVDFLTIARGYEGSMTQMSSLLKYERHALYDLVHKTLGDARKVLLRHSQTATTAW